MGDTKNENKTLVSKNTTDLVRVGNSLKITNKLLSESNFEFSGQFKGVINSKIDLPNLNHVHYSFINQIDNSIILLSKTGELLEIKLTTLEIIKKNEAIKRYIISNNITDWLDQTVYMRHASLSDSNIYISRGNNKLVKYNIYDDSINEITLSKIDDIARTDTFYGFIVYENKIYSPTISHPPLDKLEMGEESDKHSISVFSKDPTLKIKSLAGFDITYDNLTIVDGLLFAINQNGVKDFAGQILKQDIITGEHKFINIFSDSWIDDFVVIGSSSIICYSKLYINDVLVSKIAILNGIKGTISQSFEFDLGIREIIISTCKTYVGILFENGLVKILNHESFKIITEFIFEEIIDTDYSANPVHIWTPHILHIHKGYIYVGNRKELRKYS